MTLTEIYTNLYNSSIINPSRPGTDNCDKGTIHSYIPFYEQLFNSHREKNVNVLEIGIQGGICMLLWQEFFHNANKIVGVDISLDSVQQKVFESSKKNNKIEMVQHDATLPSVLDILHDNYDIIIDDGSHQLSHQLDSFNLFKDRLNDGGIYVIEDVQGDGDANYLKNSIPGSEIVDLRSVKHRYDDLVLVYRK